MLLFVATTDKNKINLFKTDGLSSWIVGAWETKAPEFYFGTYSPFLYSHFVSWENKTWENNLDKQWERLYCEILCVCVCVCVRAHVHACAHGHSAVSDSLLPHGRDTWVHCHFLLQRIYFDPEVEPRSPELAGRFFTTEPPVKHFEILHWEGS